MNGSQNRSVDAMRRDLTAQFKAAGIDSPELDARLLVGAAVGLDHTGLSIHGSRVVTDEEVALIEKYATRRMAHEPVARILGTKEFWGLNFKLSPAALVPRPDTETVVSATLEFLRDQEKTSRDIRIADIGTGSGAILLALLSECRMARGVGTDISDDALTIARLNASNLGLSSRAEFVKSDFASVLSRPFDLIVSNPPYIRSKDIARLDVDVRDFDPHLALDGGNDGLDAYRHLVPQSVGLLASGGALIVEVGHDQAVSVVNIMAASGLRIMGPPRTDLGGIERVVLAQKP